MSGDKKPNQKHAVRKRCILCIRFSKSLKLINSTKVPHSDSNRSFVEIIEKCFNLSFPVSNEAVICSDCVKEMIIADGFRKKVDEARKKIHKDRGITDQQVIFKELKDESGKNLKNMEINDSIAIGNVTIKKIKVMEQFDDIDNNIFIIDLDGSSHNIDLENNVRPTYQPSGSFYIRPLTEMARKNIMKSLELKNKLSNEDYKKEQYILNLPNVTIKRCDSAGNEITKENVNVLKNILNSNNVKDNVASSANKTTKIVRRREVLQKRKICKKTSKYPPIDSDCIKCPVCGIEYETHDKLLPHYRKHFNKFLCYKCGNTFTSSSELLIHLKTHSNAIYHCPMCPKQYKSKNMVAHHIKRYHKKMKLYSCSECKIRFNYLVARRQHAYEVHGVKTFNFSCTECGKLFFRSPDLQRHVKLVHLNQRDFFCLLCERAFFTSRTLQEHMVTHTGIKDYHCEKCGKGFTRLGSLKEHLKIHLNIKEHKCHVCQREFVQKVALKIHLKTHGVIMS